MVEVFSLCGVCSRLLYLFVYLFRSLDLSCDLISLGNYRPPDVSRNKHLFLVSGIQQCCR
jgi:hypothetical protein